MIRTCLSLLILIVTAAEAAPRMRAVRVSGPPSAQQLAPAASGAGVYLLKAGPGLLRIGEDGKAIGEPIPYLPNPSVIVFDGTVFHVINARSGDFVTDLRVTPSGELLDAEPRVIRQTPSGSNLQGAGGATNDGGVTLVAWMERGAPCGKGCSLYEVKGAALDRNGSQLALFTIVPASESVAYFGPTAGHQCRRRLGCRATGG